jgi:aminoglycoside N3'-acetyltransferase
MDLFYIKWLKMNFIFGVNNMYTLDELKNDLRNIGINKGDTVLVRADLGSIGKLETKQREDYINFMLDVVGAEGTIIGLSFTKGFFIKHQGTDIFDGSNKSYTGSFANTMLKHPLALRSKHPTNSYVAIGKNAKYIIDNHNEKSGAYEPIRKIMELNGKMILIGCVKNKPGFTTTHLAEVDLGLHKRIIFPKLNGGLYISDNKVKVFKRTDLGGCSSTFYKFYANYVKDELLNQGYIGNAYSVLINAKEAYSLEFYLLSNNPKFNICNDKTCTLCRTRRWDNLIDSPGFLLKKLLTKLKKRF